MLGTFLHIQCGMSQTPSHADTTSLLCPTRLQGQTDKHPYGAKQTPIPKSEIDSDTIYNGSLPTM